MRNLPTKLEIIGPTNCKHPWTEEDGWESVEVSGAEEAEHKKVIKEFIDKGYTVWIDGFLQDTNIHGAYLIRKL